MSGCVPVPRIWNTVTVRKEFGRRLRKRFEILDRLIGGDVALLGQSEGAERGRWAAWHWPVRPRDPRSVFGRDRKEKMMERKNIQSQAKGFFPGFENGLLKCSAAVCVSAVWQNILPLHSRNLGKTLFGRLCWEIETRKRCYLLPPEPLREEQWRIDRKREIERVGVEGYELRFSV